MIDIIIPIYNSKLTLSRTLDSIVKQVINCDYLVTLVDDCSIDNYDDIIDNYKDIMKINYLRLDKNSGSGVARQYGIDNTSGEYICFIDSDDVFYDEHSLNRLYKMILTGYDVVSGIEYDEDRQIRFINEGDLHGKLYKRKYILDKDIRFNDTRFHEDNYFNSLVILSGAKNFNLMQNVYVYCYNDKSITKIDKQKEFDRLEILLSNMSEVFDRIPITSDNIDLFKHYIYIKYRIINRLLLENKDDNNLQKIKEWVKKYDSRNVDLIGIYDFDELEDLVQNKNYLEK